MCFTSMLTHENAEEWSDDSFVMVTGTSSNPSLNQLRQQQEAVNILTQACLKYALRI